MNVMLRANLKHARTPWKREVIAAKTLHDLFSLGAWVRGATYDRIVAGSGNAGLHGARLRSAGLAFYVRRGYARKGGIQRRSLRSFCSVRLFTSFPLLHLFFCFVCMTIVGYRVNIFFSLSLSFLRFAATSLLQRFVKAWLSLPEVDLTRTVCVFVLFLFIFCFEG